MQFLDPKNDVAFKKIFGSEEHKNITISFLNSMLELTGQQAIKDVSFLNNEQLSQTPEKKDNVLDVVCVDQVGNKYIVEIQVRRVKDFDKRMVFYGTQTYSMQLGKGRDYVQLMPVITLAIVGFDLFPNKKHYKSIHHFLDNKTFEHDIKELSFVFVELKKFEKSEQELVSAEDKWLYFLKNINAKSAIPAPLHDQEFEEACQAATRMTWPEKEFDAYIDEFVRETDQQGMVELALEQGEAKGIEKGIILVAKNMLAQGIDVAIIAQATGLSVEAITTLKKQK